MADATGSGTDGTGPTAQIRPIFRQVRELSVEQIVRDELPFVNALYNPSHALHQNIRDWLAFYIANADALPMYELEPACADRVCDTLTRYHSMLVDALQHVFRLAPEEVRWWYDCTAARDETAFDQFLAYAKATYEQSRSSFGLPGTVYGRFDAAVSAIAGEVLGVYEFNGDTPVMLFESVNLQNLISQSLGEPQHQANDWWHESLERFQSLAGKAIAVVCDIAFIEDAATCETLAQMFEAVGARVYFTTVTGLNHDVMALAQPFYVDGVDEPMQVVFMLLPWEEMMLTGRDILAHWRTWYRQVRFYEPPWRWFMSHKGMLAFVTYLLDTDNAFRAKHGGLPHLRAELSPDYFVKHGLDYVAKPVVGRLSQNISIHQRGVPTESTQGVYAKEPMVYQAYCAPSCVQGRNNFIVGGWLSAGNVSTLCFREFDGPVLDLQNERFIAHRLAMRPDF